MKVKIIRNIGKYKIGQVREMSAYDARLLVATKIGEIEDQEPTKKRRYKRRDMVAAE